MQRRNRVQTDSFMTRTNNQNIASKIQIVHFRNFRSGPFTVGIRGNPLSLLWVASNRTTSLPFSVNGLEVSDWTVPLQKIAC